MTRATDIYIYLDYREYLRDFFAHKKKENKIYSQRYFAQKMGVKSSGFFSDVFNGKRNLSTTNIVQVSQGLKLKVDEAHYFETLVRFNQGKTIADKKYWLNKIMRCKNIDVKLLNKDSYQYFSHWYHAVIRELLFFYPLKDEFSELASALIPSIKTEEAKASVQLLEDLGLIAKNKEGFYKQKDAILSTGESIRSIEVAQFQIKMMEHASVVFDKIPAKERDVSSLTLSLSPEGYKDIHALLQNTKNEILKIAKHDSHEKRVYQLNLQYFPVTKKNIKTITDSSISKGE